MGTGHRDDVAMRQHVLRQPGGAGRVRQPVIEDVLHAGVAAGHGVADDNDVGCGRELPGVVPGPRCDAGVLEHVAHRRVHVRVGAGDPVAELACDERESGHEGSADSQKVNVHALCYPPSGKRLLRSLTEIQ